MMQLGEKPHRYEWIEDWAKLPAGKSFGFTHGVATDAQGNVYVHNSSVDGVCVFDRQGNFLLSWGPQFEGGAHGMRLTSHAGQQFLYFADIVRRVVEKYTLDGKNLWSIGCPPRQDIYAQETDFKPTDVCPAPDGTFYVMDGYGKPWVHRYSPSAQYIDSFGGEGTGPGQLKCPHGGWIDNRRVAGGGEAELYIADRGNNRIQVFTLDGRYRRFVTENQNMPCGFYEFQGKLYIPDLKARLTILDQEDRLICHLGEGPEYPCTPNWPNIQYKLRPGIFSSPHACCVDSIGDIYVVEWVSTGRVTKLRRV